MDDLVTEFSSHHGLDLDAWPWGRKLLAAFLAGRNAVLESIGSAPESVLQTEPSFGLLYQLGERATEQISGSIACFATKNAASSELAARAAIEISVNIRFMLSGDRNSRVVAWIREYVRQDEKQIVHWERALEHLPESVKHESAPRIAARRKVHELRKLWLSGAETEFAQQAPLNLREPWPNIADRFEQIGESVAYRTAYARLSSQTHADAEDTLNYIFFSSVGEKALLQMSQETVAFSEYLIAYGGLFYFFAMKKFSEAFKLSLSAQLDVSTAEVLGLMKEVSDIWNW